MSMETNDLLLKKATPEDWEAMYRNVWSRPEAARYMQWQITTSAVDAQARMARTIAWQTNHDTYYEKPPPEEKTDLRNGAPYELEVYWKQLQPEP